MSLLAQMISDAPEAFKPLADSPHRTDLKGRTREHLLVAVSIYMRSKFGGDVCKTAIFSYFLGSADFWARTELDEYCELEYPDICMCGKLHSQIGSVLRTHCNECRLRNIDSRTALLAHLSRIAYVPSSWVHWAVAKHLARDYSL